jgi:hypothetical protein
MALKVQGKRSLDRLGMTVGVPGVAEGRLGEGRFNRPHILPSLSKREVRMGLEAFTSATVNLPLKKNDETSFSCRP